MDMKMLFVCFFFLQSAVDSFPFIYVLMFQVYHVRLGVQWMSQAERTICTAAHMWRIGCLSLRRIYIRDGDAVHLEAIANKCGFHFSPALRGVKSHLATQQAK